MFYNGILQFKNNYNTIIKLYSHLLNEVGKKTKKGNYIMAKRKLPKDVDLTKNINPADGFFSNPMSSQKDQENSVEKKADTAGMQNNVKKNKNLGGRPHKKGLKNEQFSLTMNPELYEKLRIVAQERTDGNFSALIDLSIKAYCDANKIKLDKIKVDPAILEAYRIKQDKKREKNR